MDDGNSGEQRSRIRRSVWPAYGRDETIARAFEMGAADYVLKPFSPTELKARMGSALRRRKVAKPL